MKPNQERKEALFEAARHLGSRAERAAYLDRACAHDPELRRQAEAMLEAEAAADDYFRTASAPGDAVREVALRDTSTASADPLAEAPGTIIGRYKLLQQIGEGGFGVVYMAEQQEPVRRKVALKIIKLGMDTKQVVARFEAERQALALMDHPHIAKVLDAGVTGQKSEVEGQRSDVGIPPSGSGRPYFVMELVHGIPITAYCDKHNLSPAERLKLFLPVCQAIQHAHQKGIIHRDIKPSNVLVTLNDGVPHPMVIDFGVAKALNQRLTEKTLYTEFGQMIGTPVYMSPEQAEMSKLDVDTRSDIYSLGVLLYELLTGTTPFPEQRLRSAGWMEMQRIIAEEEPPRPSTRLSALAEAERTGVAQHRQIEAPKLIHLVRGELDWVVMKCLEKDRTRRYETANGLAMDLQRYLHDEPVSAVAPSARYRTMKFVRRHRAGLAVTAALFGLLVAGVVVSMWQMVRAREAERAAVAARGQAEAVSEFLVEAFRSPDPERDGRKVTVAEVLDDAVKKLEGRFKEAPERKAALLDALGETYLGLGLYQEAERLLRECFDLRRRALGPEHPDTLKAMLHLSNYNLWPDRFAEAEALARESLVLHRRVLGGQHTNTLAAMGKLANVLMAQKKYAEAEALLTDALRIHRQTRELETPQSLECMSDLATIYAKLNRLRESEALHLETLRTIRRVLGPQHPLLLAALNQLGYLYKEKEAVPAQALPLFREALDASLQALGPEHPNTLIIMRNTAYACEDLGQLQEAEKLQRQALEVLRRVSGPEHKTTLTVMDDLASTCSDLGKLTEAEQLCHSVLETRRRVLGAEHPETLASMRTLGTIYMSQGRLAEAEKLLKETLELQRRVAGPEGSGTSVTLHRLAGVYLEQNRLAEAETLFQEWLERKRGKLGPEHPETLIATHNLALVYSKQERLDEAENLHRQVLEVQHRVLGLEHQDTLKSMHALAANHVRQRRFAEAEKLFAEALEICRRGLGPEHSQTLAILHNFGVCYSRHGRLTEAGERFQEALQLRRKTLGPEHPHTLQSTLDLATNCENLNRLDQAEALFKEALETARRKWGVEHPLTLLAMNRLASLYSMKLGRPAEAEPLFREGLEASRRFRGPEHEETLAMMNNLALAYDRQNRPIEAEQLYEETLKLERTGLGTAHAYTRITMINLADLTEKLGKLDRSIALKLEHLKAGTATPAAYSGVLETIEKVTSKAERSRHLAQFADTCAEVMTNQPKLAGDLDKGVRYLAARGVAAAAAPQTEAQAGLESTEQARLRALVLGWLRADLTLWTGRLDTNAPMKALAIEEALTRWQRAAELASIRDPAALRASPEKEREAFAKLWTEVAALHDSAKRLKEQSFATLLAQGSRWAYWDDRSDPGTAWLEPGFDDATWKRGPSPLGYGDPGMATTVDFGPDKKSRPITTYFRSAFALERPEQFARVALRLRCDDGAAVYINAREVLRENLPAEVSLASGTVALKPVKGEAEVTYFVHELALDSLRPGTNTLAVEVHQSEPASSDLVFDLEILALRKK